MAKFICSIPGCGQSFPLEQINHHEMYECLHRNIQCPAPYCKFINKLETVINHSIECPFHLIYCAKCKTLSNVSVLKHDCKVIQAQRTIPSDIKYYHEDPPLNHLHGDVLLGIHSFNESFEDYYYNRYDSFMSVSHGLPSPTPLLSTSFFNVKMKFDIIALGTLYFHLHHYFLDAFFNARMELKIYYLIILIIIMIALLFSVFYLLFICVCFLSMYELFIIFH